MINILDIKGRSAIALLEKYSGVNPYIIGLRTKLIQNKKLLLTPNQATYITDNATNTPLYINRVVEITEYLGLELQKQNKLSFVPKKIMIEFLLAETDKSFHVYGKLTTKQPKSVMYWLPKTQVIDDPYYAPIDLEVDFSKYNETLSKLGKTLFNHQEVGVKFLLTRKGCILADDMGLGKFFPTKTPIYTPKGKKNIGDLVLGEEVIGSDGKPTKVTGIFPQGVKEQYRVTFNDGYSIICGGEHLWSVSSNNSGNNSKNRENRYITLSTEQMLDKDLELEQIGTGWNEKRPYKFKTYYKQKNGDSKWQIPIVKPIEFINNDMLPIEPYLLGLGLGDGHFKGKNIIFQVHKDDFDEMFNDYLIKENKPSDNKRKGYININESLFNLNLEDKRSHTKFIPEIYKYSSIENRLAILQGLMDTDGHCLKSSNGVFTGTEYCTVSEKLADDVAEIVHSLGGIVRKSSKIGSYKKPDGTKIECKRAYKLNIKLPEDMNPFRLKRKMEAYNPPKKYAVGRYIKNIELEVGCHEDSVCISVDAIDKLYVVEHAIVTHNTTQAIVAGLELGAKKIMVLCPSSAKINWEREINIFDKNTAIVEGKNWVEDKFTIINYDILKNFHTLPKDVKEGVEPNKHMLNANFDLIIIDEAHYLKNNDSIRGNIMTDLINRSGVERVWLLSGTPVANRPMDFYNLLKLIKSPLVENWKHYTVRYCEGKQFFRTLKNGKKKQIWLTDGASNLDELHAKTKNIMLRRLKNEVLDMPDKIVTPVYHAMDNKAVKRYNDLWDEYIQKKISEGKRVGHLQKDLVELILLRQFIALEAIQHTIEMAENVVESGNKLIIFTTFKEEQIKLMEYFGKQAVCHNGEMSAKQKQKSVDDFQNNPKIKIFIGNIISAGVAITLTEATVVIFNSFDWVTGNNEQGEDRCYRIGQKNNVNIYYQLFMNTISERMWSTLMSKKDIIGKILGSITKEAETERIMETILEEIDK